MALLIPNETIARQWNGAREARLRRAPLEEFLRFHGLKLTLTGAARDTDNLVRAVFHLIDAGLAVYRESAVAALDDTRQRVVTHIACVLCERLASEYLEPSAWRIAALVSSAQLLSSQQGLVAAAHVTAYAVHDYSVRVKRSRRAAQFEILGERALAGIRGKDPGTYAELARCISERLAAGSGDIPCTALGAGHWAVDAL